MKGKAGFQQIDYPFFSILSVAYMERGRKQQIKNENSGIIVDFSELYPLFHK